MDRQGADPRAAAAKSPAQLPARSWKDVLVATWKESSDDNVEIIAAGVAFYAFLAFVPLLTAFVLSYGLVAEPSSVVSHMQTLTSVMPQNTAEMIGDQLTNMTTGADAKTGFALILAIAIALYGASKGAGAIMTALNIAFEVKETRSFIKRTLMAFAMTLCAIFVLFLAMIAISAVHFIEGLLPAAGGFTHLLIQIGFFVLAAAAVMALLAAIYRYGPNRPDAKWVWVSPGSVAATLLWLVGTAAFGIYVSNFGNYNATYGSLGAVIVFLTWLYLSAYIVVMGAELNSELERKVGQDKVADEKAAGNKTRIDNVRAEEPDANRSRDRSPSSPAAAAGGAQPQQLSAGEVAWKWSAFSLLLGLLGRSRRVRTR